MNQLISQILSKSGTPETNICPTLLYNEGWMTRLLVATSIEAKISLEDLDFSKVQHWYSEGLLEPPFLAKKQGDNLAEGYTHTDIAIGDFEVGSSGKGDIKIQGTEGMFGVIEAKMGSPLSPGTKNAPNYNQASRNLACIAFNTLSTGHDIYFSVVAPEIKIAKHKIKEQADPHVMLGQIADRFEMYDKETEVYALKGQVIERAGTCKCSVISYESWIDALSNHDSHSSLVEFKDSCYAFNKVG